VGGGLGGRRSRLFKEDYKVAFRSGRLDGDHFYGDSTQDALVAHLDSFFFDRLSALSGFGKSGAQCQVQPPLRHFEEIETGPARRRSQVGVRISTKVEDVHFRVNDGAGRGKTSQHTICLLLEIKLPLSLFMHPALFLLVWVWCCSSGGSVDAPDSVGPPTSGFFHIELPFVFSGMCKEIGAGPNGFRGSEQEHAVGSECIVEGLDHLPLRQGLQVDQHILTREQIKPRERRVLEQIVLRKDAEVADDLANLVAPIDTEKKVI
jgi:hypothetical protein